MNRTRAIRMTKKKKFLENFLKYCVVSRACDASGVGRRTFYDWLQSDEDFKAQYEDVEKKVAETLEEEAIRRAYKGINKPVFYQGVVCGHVREYSDTLLIFLLKAHNPSKFRERIEHTGEGGGPIQIEDARAKLLGLLEAIEKRLEESVKQG